MDIALAIERLVPEAEYFGSVTSNTIEAWAAIDWIDTRDKPSWAALEAVWNEVDNAMAKDEIMRQLHDLDLKSIRPVRAILRGNPTDEEFEYLNALGENAANLRDTLNDMGA